MAIPNQPQLFLPNGTYCLILYHTEGYFENRKSPLTVLGRTIKTEKSQEVNTRDMDTLGYFIYMDEMEKQQKQQQEDSDDSGSEETH